MIKTVTESEKPILDKKPSLTKSEFQQIKIENDPLRITFKTALPQIVASTIAFSTVIQSGVYMAYSAILLPQLTSSGITINTNQASWIASCVALAIPISSMLTGTLLDKFGRKTVCMLSCFPFLLSYLSFTFATSVTHIFMGRVFSGIAGGLTTAALVYASESTCTEIRSSVLCLNSVAVAFGILVTCVLSLWFTWRIIAGILAVFTIFCLVLLFFIPETPYWYKLFKKDFNSADRSLKWLYRQPELYQREFENTISKVQITPENITKDDFKTKYGQPEVYKPIILLIALFGLQQMTGCYAVIFYAVNLFQHVGGYIGVVANEYISLLLLGIIRFVIALIVAVYSSRIKRKTLLIVSSTGMALSSVTAAINIFIGHDPVQTEQWGIMLCILLYVSFSAIGLLVIPWTLLGELLPVRVRGQISGLMVSIAYGFMFISLKLFLPSLELFGSFYIFSFMAVTSFLTSLFTWFFLPETLGKSFEQIENYFK